MFMYKNLCKGVVVVHTLLSPVEKRIKRCMKDTPLIGLLFNSVIRSISCALENVRRSVLQ